MNFHIDSGRVALPRADSYRGRWCVLSRAMLNSQRGGYQEGHQELPGLGGIASCVQKLERTLEGSKKALATNSKVEEDPPLLPNGGSIY
jgi:hypothetical protein